MLNIIEEAKKMQNEIVTWRRELHQIPEVGLELPQTSAYVIDKLKKMDVECKPNVGVSGVIGLIKGGMPGKVIALRADMDALPIKEESNLSFAAKNNNMHACGHDTHTAMLLGAANILGRNRDKLSGTVKLIFQPDEEGAKGAKSMIKDGVMENPNVDAILGLHIGTIFKEIGTGQIGVSYGRLMASFDKFYIKLKGHGSHGAMPHMGIDPVVMAGHIITALQTIVSREMKPTHPAVVTIGKVYGGAAYNVIPGFVEIEGTIRALDEEDRQMIIKRIEEIVSGITKAMRGEYEYSITLGAPPVVNNSEFTKTFVDTAKSIIGAENVIEIIEPTMGGEDMAYYLSKVPGTFFFLGSGNEAKGITYPHHNCKFMVDEDVFWKGTALLAQGAINWLENNK